MKVYNSYEEVDNDLRILRLQTQINKEKIKLNYHHIKEDLEPINMVTGIIGTIAKKAFVLKSVAKLVGITKAKMVNKKSWF